MCREGARPLGGSSLCKAGCAEVGLLLEGKWCSVGPQEGARELWLEEPWPEALTKNILSQLNPSSLGLSFLVYTKGRLTTVLPTSHGGERSFLRASRTKCIVLRLITE